MTHTITYAWKEGRGFKVPAQVVGEELEKIEQRYGQIDAKHVVTVAANPTSPLHNFFEWNDAKAATQYRLDQARGIIQCVIIKAIGDKEQRPVRAFVNISVEAGRQYNSITTVMSDKEKRARLIAQAKSELEDWRERYNDLREFSEVFEAIRQLEAA